VSGSDCCISCVSSVGGAAIALVNVIRIKLFEHDPAARDWEAFFAAGQGPGQVVPPTNRARAIMMGSPMALWSAAHDAAFLLATNRVLAVVKDEGRQS
jgi:hypothetical protein